MHCKRRRIGLTGIVLLYRSLHCSISQSINDMDERRHLVSLCPYLNL